MELLRHFIDLFVASAPWLIFGLVVAGLMKGLLPEAWMKKQLGSRHPTTIIKAAFIGAPLPLCSCGVVPAALAIRRAGASKSATVSFLVATPETGPDSISLSYALLGPFMAVIRPIAAITSAIVAGCIVRLGESTDTDSQSPETAQKKSCCSTKPQPVPAAKSCCGSKSTPPANPLISGLRYSFGKLLADISGWLVFGILVAAIIQAYVPLQWLAQWGSGLPAMLIMTVIGVPMYICASASTPIAAGFLAAGLSPGAILVFMLAGPATNIGTLGIIKKELGTSALSGYLIGVISTALAFGLITDYYLVPNFSWAMPLAAVGEIHDHTTWIEQGAGLVLVGLMLYANWDKIAKKR